MKPYLFILPACVMTLPAQDAWDALVRPRALEAYPSWRFIRRDQAGRAALFSEEILPARAGADIRRSSGPEEAFQALAEKLSLAQAPTWALVDPEGQVRLHGDDEPTGKALREALEGGGWIPRWERRQAFLREHPGHGDATLDALWEVERRFLLLRFTLEVQRQKGPELRITWPANDRPDPQMAKLLAGPMGLTEGIRPCRQALGWFGALPEDPEWTRAWMEVHALGMGGMASQEALVEEFRGLLRDLEEQLRREPARDSLWSAWLGLASVLPDVDGESLVAGLEAAPGTTWPIRQAALAVTRRMDPQQRLDRAESELAGPGDGRARMHAWAGIKLGALLALKRDDEARLWILEARGRDRAAFGDAQAKDWVEKDHPAQAALQSALEQELPEPRSEAGSSLLLVLLGNPAWSAEFERLERHPELDAWSRGWAMLPGELAFHRATGTAERELRERLHLPPATRWILLQGQGDCLAQGAGMPDPKLLAQSLRKAETPLLERLEAFVRTHPGHRQGQEKLVEALTERMPHPRLELKLAQACAKLGEAPILRSADFKPQLPLWESLGRKAVLAADARLARWPESLEAWMAWMDWQSVLPTPASPAERLRGLAVWKSGLRGGPGPLPLDVVVGVAQRMERAGRWKELAEWGLLQWDGGWGKAMGWGHDADPDEDAAELETRQKARKDLVALAQGTLRALFTLGRKAELQRVQEEWRAADPLHLAGLGRAKPQ